jgi:hypothetical protein
MDGGGMVDGSFLPFVAIESVSLDLEEEEDDDHDDKKVKQGSHVLQGAG